MPRIIQKANLCFDRYTDPLKLVEIILANRHISSDELENFLNPPHPKNIPPVEVNISLKSLIKYKNILIYGDYDVDGITSTAILWQTLHRLGLNVTPFIPDREADGYGFKYSSFVRFQQEKGIKVDLLITVDNGIVAYPELQKAKTDGVNIIVIDHHLPDHNYDQLKSIVLHLVHSTLVSGAALSWFVAQKLDPQADLGLAALGTVADCMPLAGVNRSLVVHGLRELRLNPCPGIKKLFEVSGVKTEEISAYHLGYILGPRINAVGRLSNPLDALRLICAPNATVASKFAPVLDGFNKDRQVLQSEHLKLADTQIDLSHKLLFVADNSYHPGIIGLIAGRLTEKYYLPSVAISLNGEIAKGSCRSIPELNIIETLRQHLDLFVDVGGHAGAAGFSIKSENIPKLKAKLINTVDNLLSDKVLEPTLEVDAEMKLSAATVKNYQALDKLQPFGLGNPEPLFLFKDLKIVQKRLVGASGDHLSLKLDDPATKTIEMTSTSAIAFKKGSLDSKLQVGDKVDIVASLGVNTWNGVTIPQLMVKEIINL
jgi:single-stranded-DNA-specific exonuclease